VVVVVVVVAGLVDCCRAARVARTAAVARTAGISSVDRCLLVRFFVCVLYGGIDSPFFGALRVGRTKLSLLCPGYSFRVGERRENKGDRRMRETAMMMLLMMMMMMMMMMMLLLLLQCRRGGEIRIAISPNRVDFGIEKGGDGKEWRLIGRLGYGNSDCLSLSQLTMTRCCCFVVVEMRKRRRSRRWVRWRLKVFLEWRGQVSARVSQ
jgi:hypothetical protein